MTKAELEIEIDSLRAALVQTRSYLLTIEDRAVKEGPHWASGFAGAAAATAQRALDYSRRKAVRS